MRKTIHQSEMALFFRVHALVCSQKSLTPPTLLEMAIFVRRAKPA